MIFTDDDIYNLAIVAGLKTISRNLLSSLNSQLTSFAADILKKLSYFTEHEDKQSTVTLSMVRNAVPSTYDNCLDLRPMYNVYSLSENELQNVRENYSKYRFTHRNRFIKSVFTKHFYNSKIGIDYSSFTDEAIDFLQKYLENYVIEELHKTPEILIMTDNVILNPRRRCYNIPSMKINFLPTIKQGISIFGIDDKDITLEAIDYLNTLLNYIVSALFVEISKYSLVYHTNYDSNLILAAKMLGLGEFVKDDSSLRENTIHFFNANLLQKTPLKDFGLDHEVTTYMILYNICRCFLTSYWKLDLLNFHEAIGIPIERDISKKNSDVISTGVISTSGAVEFVTGSGGMRVNYIHSGMNEDISFSEVKDRINNDDKYIELNVDDIHYIPVREIESFVKVNVVDPDIKYRDTPYISDVNTDLIGRINSVLCSKPQTSTLVSPQLSPLSAVSTSSSGQYTIPQPGSFNFSGGFTHTPSPGSPQRSVIISHSLLLPEDQKHVRFADPIGQYLSAPTSQASSPQASQNTQSVNQLEYSGASFVKEFDNLSNDLSPDDIEKAKKPPTQQPLPQLQSIPAIQQSNPTLPSFFPNTYQLFRMDKINQSIQSSQLNQSTQPVQSYTIPKIPLLPQSYIPSQTTSHFQHFNPSVMPVQQAQTQQSSQPIQQIQISQITQLPNFQPTGVVHQPQFNFFQTTQNTQSVPQFQQFPQFPQFQSNRK